MVTDLKRFLDTVNVAIVEATQQLYVEGVAKSSEVEEKGRAYT